MLKRDIWNDSFSTKWPEGIAKTRSPIGGSKYAPYASCLLIESGGPNLVFLFFPSAATGPDVFLRVDHAVMKERLDWKLYGFSNRCLVFDCFCSDMYFECCSPVHLPRTMHLWASKLFYVVRETALQLNTLWTRSLIYFCKHYIIFFLF